ncbi:MAG TPA: ABC transporter substrate-binding protein [Candidatus Binatia bacterium]|nr:ABC transporter substrate-binding protein [Candidatus Binatia bacterium]
MKVPWSQRSGIGKHVFCLALCALLLALSLPAESQQPQLYRIGYLAARSALEARDEAFRQGLRDLGYIEGKDIIIEYRFAEGKSDRIPMLAAELISRKVDIIVASGTPVAQGAKAATRTIPIVFAGVADPVGTGLVTSLARPGGNITGVTPISAELSAKRLELLKETDPKVSRVVVLSTADYPLPVKTDTLNEMEGAARILGLQLQLLEVRGANDFERAFAAMRRERAEAFTVLPIPLFLIERRRIVDFATKSRLPTIFHWREYVEAGGLMSYGADADDLFRRAATYVDKIFKGAKPADLPVEQPTKFEFIINLKTAKQIGLTIPPNVLARADKVIR